MEQDILLVDDDPDDIDLALLAFGRSRLKDRLVVARSGAEALERMFPSGKKPPIGPMPRVVLLDIKMPRISGFDILSRLRASAFGSKVRVVMLSSSSESRDSEEALQRGADIYVRKPARFEEFFDLVRRVESLLALERSP